MITSHMVWALIGFFIGIGCLWAYHMLRTRGFRYFWYHPLLAGVIVVVVLYVLDRLLTWLSELEVSFSWTLMFVIILPLAILAGLFFYRAVMLHRKSSAS
ncbi:MAG: hypothetical protein K2O70_10435 [Desulfovibrionaceae bacterium]|nr:hypothetical protein [Desulfovibrionaceae bacterium]